jgi:serine/threonine protein kinase
MMSDDQGFPQTDPQIDQSQSVPLAAFLYRDFNCRIRIVRKIAAGGMGTVSEGIMYGVGGFEKRVAIKEILPRASNDHLFVEMFISEARLVADLVHENIVQIYHLNRQDSQYFIVMEYVHGLSLAEFIDRHQTTEDPTGLRHLPLELAVFITSRIARGLAYAHSRLDAKGRPLHIVHRDVCPKNILITTEGLPKLGDFGIASAGVMQMDQGQFGAVGKLSYMAPEQAAIGLVDFRADIFSLGLVLAELISLKPMRDKWKNNLMTAAINGWSDWEALPADLPDDLRVILKKMLAEDPADRYQSTGELARDLEVFIYGHGYGPTVVTLESYLRELAPDLYRHDRELQAAAAQRVSADALTKIRPSEVTD